MNINPEAKQYYLELIAERDNTIAEMNSEIEGVQLKYNALQDKVDKEIAEIEAIFQEEVTELDPIVLSDNMWYTKSFANSLDKKLCLEKYEDFFRSNRKVRKWFKALKMSEKISKPTLDMKRLDKNLTEIFADVIEIDTKAVIKEIRESATTKTPKYGLVRK